MLPESVLTLLHKIYGDMRNEEIQQKLRDKPVELLNSLLERITEELSEPSATLRNIVHSSAGGVLESVKKRQAEAAKKKKEPAKK